MTGRIRRVPRHPRRDERGAFLVVWALVIVAVLIMVAIVVDLGQARSTRRLNQQLADFAALAAGNTIDTTGSGEEACREAFASIRANAPDLPSGSPNCNPMVDRCTASTPVRNVTFAAGEYSIVMTYPVDTTDSLMADTRRADTERDGTRCERFKVAVEQTEETFFGAVAGADTLTTSGAAISMATAERDKEVPSLWLLDPEDCTSLNVSGGSTLRVGLATADPPVLASPDTVGEGNLTGPVGGFVTIDSNGTRCSGQQTTLDADNSSRIQAVPGPPGETAPPPQTGTVAGAIRLWALPEGVTGCPSSDDNGTSEREEDHACQVSDLGTSVTPTPSALESRATRAPIDHRYNCRPTTTTDPTPYPDFHGVELDACGTGSPAYIDQMRAALGGPAISSTPPPPLVPAGYTTLPNGALGMPNCSPNGVRNVPPGNYYVDCPTLTIGNGTVLSFEGGNLVFRGGIKLTGSGVLNINTANVDANPANNHLRTALLPTCRDVFCPTDWSSHHAIVYQRSGDLEMTGGVLNVSRTMVYQHDGSVKVTGGAPPSWTAPKEAPRGGTYADRCTAAMPCSPFQGLALWSEKSADYTINGGGTLNLEGVFFTPEAKPFKLTGGGGFTPLRAQFIAYQLTVSGGGTLRLVPDARQHIPQTRRAAILIR